MDGNIAKKNVLYSVVLQIVTIVCGLIIPKIILDTFGSEVNGLVNSMSQFLNYITLLEGGVSGVIMASLYKPLAEKDEYKISRIFVATQRFFRQIGYIYCIYALALAVIYPLIVKSELSYLNMLVLCIVLASNLFFQYFFALSYKVLLSADRKIYYVSGVQIITTLLNALLVIFIAKAFPNIIFVKVGSALVFLVQPILYSKYTKKNYQIDYSVKPDNEAISQRWDGFGQNLAYFIHSNTDIVLLTFMASLEEVSVYAIYLMVVNALKNLVNSISSAIAPSLGNVLAKDDDVKSKNIFFNIYEFIIGNIATVCFVSCAVLIVPFISLYTSSIHDANYIRPLFAVIITAAEYLYCIRAPYISVAYVSGKFKDTAKYAYIEAAMNIVISISLIYPLGLVGVAIGTLVSMAYRMTMHIIYCQKNILFRDFKYALRALLGYFICAVVSYVLCNSFLGLNKIDTYWMWGVKAIGVFLLTLLILLLVNIVINHNLTKDVYYYFFEKKGDKKNG